MSTSTSTSTATSTTGPRPRRRSRWVRLVVVLGAIALAVAAVPLAASEAEAAGGTSTASAQALGTSLLGLSSGTADASSDGQTTSDSGILRAGIGGGGTGVAAQQARAGTAGVAACSGVVGSGGSLQLRNDGSCSTNAGAGDVLVPLGNLARLRASSITASCSVSAPDGLAVADVSLAGARIESLNVLTGAVTATTAINGSGNVTLPAGLGSVVVNSTSTTQGSPSTAGRGAATALTINIAGLASVVVAKAVCGVPTVLLPTIPLEGAPLAAGVLAAAALAGRRWWLPAVQRLAVQVGGVR